ncbi:MAG: PAS-domain containing protein [Saccharospirillum sp.]
MTNLRQRSRVTILMMAALTLGLGIVGWWALQQTERTANEVQSQTLVNVSVILGLAERAAQIAALGPYIGESAVPFQLQAERRELEDRFDLLRNRVLTITDLAFRTEMQQKIQSLNDRFQQLTDVVEVELFIREDIRAIQFELSEWLRQLMQPGNNRIQTSNSLAVYTQFLQADFTQPYQAEHQIETVRQATLNSLEAMTLEPGVLPVLRELVNSSADKLQERARVNAQKTLLFASIRAESERLTESVQGFVARVQEDIASQREQITAAVQRGRLGIMLVSLLAFLSLLEGFWFMSRMTRDLKTVTDEMTQLADGSTEERELVIERKDEIGDLVRSFGVFRRASLDLVRLSGDLESQKRLLETVFNTINDGLSVFSSDQHLLAWNERYLELFELHSQDIYIGMPLRDVQQLMNQYPHKNFSLDRQLLDMDSINDLRAREAHLFERQYDSGKVIEFRSQPMTDGGFVTLYTDMTDRRAIESQLQQSQKMEALGQLIGGVSHDFNNLLAALVGNLQLLHTSDRLTDKDRTYAERAMGIAERGTHLVERLLAFARRQHLHPERVDVPALIEGMVDLIEYSVAPNVDVVLDLDDDVAETWIDPSQLENALLNLAINASAAMSDGGQLTLKVRATGRQVTDKIEVQVSDTGSGMSPEVMRRVWEPFFTTKAVGQGSGLGLSLVYGFVRQSGGDVLLESQPGKGTRVRLFLPRPGLNGPEQEDRAGVPVPPVVLSPREIVLLVDDDASVLQPLHDAMHYLGFGTRAVSSAEAALAWVTEHYETLGAVLTDVNLGGEISGVDLANQLELDFPDLPVVLTSGLPREHLEQYFRLQPHHRLLAKPVRLAQLNEVFQRES